LGGLFSGDLAGPAAGHHIRFVPDKQKGAPMTAERIYGDDWLTADERVQLAALRSKPMLDDYDRDDIDTYKQLAGLRSAIEWMRKNGTLPPRRERRNQVANDN
jgi:hypothetical protein